ncbi:MAG: hypothetical protein ACRDHN_08955, partial [Thermomicrobiales bacterium]
MLNRMMLLPILALFVLTLGHAGTPIASPEATPNMDLGDDLVRTVLAGDIGETKRLIEQHA